MFKLSASNLQRYGVLLAVSAALTACGQAEKNVTVNKAVEKPVVKVEKFLTMTEFSGKLRATGGTFVLTECPADDGGRWDGADDPFGVIVCGSEYSVKYNEDLGKWVVFGSKEREGVAADALPRMEHSYAGPDPREGRMVIWGGTYRFDETGNVYPARAGEPSVGQLTLAGS